MSRIIKSSSGYLYSEEFAGDMSLIWDLSPSNPDYVDIQQDGVSLLPVGERVELLIPSPSSQGYVFQTHVNYTPSSEVEKAGCVLKSITDNYADIQICGEDTVIPSHLKLEYGDNSVLSVKHSDNGRIWYDVGNTKIIDANKIGFYIDKESQSDKITIKDVNVYKNNFITINNFNQSYMLRLFDSSNVEITDKFVIKRDGSKLLLDGSNISYPIPSLNVATYNANGSFIQSNRLLNVFGGDVFDLEYDVVFTLNNDRLSSTNIYDLGLINGEEEYSLKIENREPVSITGLTLRVEAYSSFNGGHREVFISTMLEDVYEKELQVDLSIGDIREFKLKVSRDKNFVNFDEHYKFRIVLE